MNYLVVENGLDVILSGAKDLRIRSRSHLEIFSLRSGRRTRRYLLFYQLLSIAGAIFILVAYAAQQARLMSMETVTYQTLNLFGGLFLCVTAVMLRQWGFILVEGMWALISAAGLWRVVTRRW